MNRLSTILLLCLPVVAQPCAASELPEPTAAQDEPDIWSRTKSAADALLRQSRETADQWWQQSHDSADELWQRSQEAAGEAWQSTREYLGHGGPDHFGRLWNQLLPTLEETLGGGRKAPGDRWMRFRNFTPFVPPALPPGVVSIQSPL